MHVHVEGTYLRRYVPTYIDKHEKKEEKKTVEAGTRVGGAESVQITSYLGTPIHKTHGPPHTLTCINGP